MSQLHLQGTNFSLLGKQIQFHIFDVSGFAALARSLPYLTYLDISFCPVSDPQMSLLRFFPNLRYLNISGCRITDQSLDYVSYLIELRELCMSHCGITGSSNIIIKFNQNQIAEFKSFRR
jgi:hypothetical protein